MGKDPLTSNIGGWLGGGSNSTSLIPMFGGPSQQNAQGSEAGQQQNVGTAQNMWNTLFNAANSYYNQTSGVRSSVINRANDILSGNYNPSSSPLYAPMKRGTEQQYGATKEDILENTPTGGTQQRALANAAIGKGQNLSNAMSQILESELGNAFNVANTSMPTSISGLTSALQGGAIPGQMMSSILQYLASLQQSSATMQGNFTSMI